MNLADLRAFVGNLLDYDPTNDTYDTQLDTLLNDAQTRVMTDKAWSFCQREGSVTVPADTTHSFSVTNGSGTVAGASFPLSSSTVTPGSVWEGARVTITDSNDLTGEYEIRYVKSAAQCFLDRDFEGATGTYTVTIKRREIYLPGNTATVMSILDASTGTPTAQWHLSKFARDSTGLDPDQTGTAEAYLPSQGVRIPAPRIVTGVTVATPGAGRGVRTLVVYMVNVQGPSPENPNTYPPGISGGRESGLSAPTTFVLADDEELNLTPETVPNTTGLYRRYYFTCAAEGIKAPTRLRHDGSGGITIGTDTIGPVGSTTLVPDTQLSTLQSQAFESDSVRLRESNGVYLSVLLYPHPSADTAFTVRRLIAPSKMHEDQDVPLIPAAYAQVIAFAALEQVALKHDNAALSSVYQRKRESLMREMEARFLGKPPRRIMRGGGLSGILPNPYGPLTFS